MDKQPVDQLPFKELLARYKSAVWQRYFSGYQTHSTITQILSYSAGHQSVLRRAGCFDRQCIFYTSRNK